MFRLKFPTIEYSHDIFRLQQGKCLGEGSLFWGFNTSLFPRNFSEIFLESNKELFYCKSSFSRSNLYYSVVMCFSILYLYIRACQSAKAVTTGDWAFLWNMSPIKSPNYFRSRNTNSSTSYSKDTTWLENNHGWWWSLNLYFSWNKYMWNIITIIWCCGNTQSTYKLSLFLIV